MAAKRGRQRAVAPTPTRKRLTAEARRESILTVALHSFAARGYDGVRTQELAAAAGVSEALMYQHFGSKRDLFEQVVLRASQALRDRLAEVGADVSEGERLDRELEAFVEFVADRSSGWSALTSQVSDPAVVAFQGKARRACIGDLADAFGEHAGLPRSQAMRNRLEQLAEAIAGGAESLAKWWGEKAKGGKSAKAARREGMDMLLAFAHRELDSIAAAATAGRRAKRSGRAG
jgi:AcrR family transcriptional regulator